MLDTPRVSLPDSGAPPPPAAKQVICHDDFLDPALFRECVDYSLATFYSSENSFKVNYTWQPPIVQDSPPVLIHTLDRAGALHARLVRVVRDKLGYQANIIMFYFWTPGSHIPWHDDGHVRAGLTIYLNDVWNRDHGGLFLYEDGATVRGIYPKPNLAVEQIGGVRHAVAPTTKTANVRATIQMFIPA